MPEYIKAGKDTYLCAYCKIPYEYAKAASDCYRNHNILYVELSREDASRLMNFLYSGNWELLTPSVVRHLEESINRAGGLK